MLFGSFEVEVLEENNANIHSTHEATGLNTAFWVGCHCVDTEIFISLTHIKEHLLIFN